MDETVKRQIEHESRVAALEQWYQREQDKLRQAGADWTTKAGRADKLLGREKTAQD